MGQKLDFVYIFRPKRENFLESLTQEEMAAMGKHVEYTGGLFSQGIVVHAGACLNGSYGIVIFRAETPEEARQIFDNDPAVQAGIIHAELHPYRIALLQELSAGK